MKRFYLLLINCLFLAFVAHAQNNDVEKDTLYSRLKAATTAKQQLTANGNLAIALFLEDVHASDSFALAAIAIAEVSRSRDLIVKSYLLNAQRYLIYSTYADNGRKAMENVNHALQVARDANIDTLQAISYNMLATVYLKGGAPDKGIASANQGLTLLPEKGFEGLKIDAYHTLGDCYCARNEMLTGFKNYLTASTIAEESDNPVLIGKSYRRLLHFYTQVENYDKAMDYAFRLLEMDRKKGDTSVVLNDYLAIGQTYSAQKQVALATLYYNKAAAYADSTHHPRFKINVELGFLNLYFNCSMYKEGMDYLQKTPELVTFLQKAGMQSELDRVYAYVKMEQHDYDSSLYYFRKAEPFYLSKSTAYHQGEFLAQYGDLYGHLKKYDEAIDMKQRAIAAFTPTGDLESVTTLLHDIDSLYYWKGDFKNAAHYQSQYYQFKDSLNAMSKEKDLLSMEIDNENKRKERESIREEEQEQRRHNIQYVGITIGIVLVFTVLLLLGFFKVPAGLVRGLGFFSFIFLFEFITLLADNQIHALTHGEPIKVMLVKIVLVAMLLPLHHWLEEKVIHYLVHKKLLMPSILRRKTDAERAKQHAETH